jgi:hypothetical protein
MSNIELNYSRDRPPIPPTYTQDTCTNTISPPAGSISYHNNNGAVPNGVPVYPSSNSHHNRRNSGNARYTPYHHHSRPTSVAASGPQVAHARFATGGHDGHGADVPYPDHHRRSLGEPRSSSRRPHLAPPHLPPPQHRSAQRRHPQSPFVLYETDDIRSLYPTPICAGTDGAKCYQGPVRLAPTSTSQPPFVGHAAQGQGDMQGDIRMQNANEGSVQPGGVGNLTAHTANATTYPHEQFVPSSAFPATPAPLVAFDSQAHYPKQSVHLTDNEYSFQQQPYYQSDGIQSIVQSDIGMSDPATAANDIHSLFTGRNSLDVNLSVGYFANCSPDQLASLGFSGSDGTPSSFQGMQSQHVYGHQSATLDLGAGLVAPAPYFASIPGGDCPTPALMPPTPKTDSSSSFLHPVPLPCNEPSVGGRNYGNSSEPATPPFLVPSSTGPSVFAGAGSIPYDSPLSAAPSTKSRRGEAHTPADLARDPTLKFLPLQRVAAARAFDHVKNKPNVPIPTAFLGPPLSSAVVMRDGVQRARCLCEGCIGIGDDSGQGEGWRRLDHLWCHMRKEHFGCVVYRCTEW